MTQQIPFPVLKAVTHFLALSDNRCGSDEHNRIIHGEPCPACHRDLAGYFDIVATEWPE